MNFPLTVLDVIKERFIETNGVKKFGGSGCKTRDEYYVVRLPDNLVDTMSRKHRNEYAQGRGVELDGKMKALRSSSAMTFNLLGNRCTNIVDPLFAPVGEYRISYEYQLPTLARNTNCAHLDARLVAENGESVVYCEMKMAEWMLGWMKMLRSSYLDSSRYLMPDEQARVFIGVFTELVKQEANSKGSRKPKFARFDALQMTKHLLALYSNLDNESARHIYLVNCVWEICTPSTLGKYEEKYLHLLETEHEEYEMFERSVAPIKELFDSRGFEFSLDYIPVDRFLSCLEKTEEQQQKLARYLI